MTDEPRDTKLIVAAARKTAGRTGGPRRSPLYDWLAERYASLKAELNPPRMPNWAAIAEQLAALGVYDGKGKPPAAVTVRQTWAKVRYRRCGPTPRKRPEAAPIPDAPPAGAPARDTVRLVTGVGEWPALAPPEDVERPRHVFGMSKLRE